MGPWCMLRLCRPGSQSSTEPRTDVPLGLGGRGTRGGDKNSDWKPVRKAQGPQGYGGRAQGAGGSRGRGPERSGRAQAVPAALSRMRRRFPFVEV